MPQGEGAAQGQGQAPHRCLGGPALLCPGPLLQPLDLQSAGPAGKALQLHAECGGYSVGPYIPLHQPAGLAAEGHLRRSALQHDKARKVQPRFLR